MIVPAGDYLVEFSMEVDAFATNDGGGVFCQFQQSIFRAAGSATELPAGSLSHLSFSGIAEDETFLEVLCNQIGILPIGFVTANMIATPLDNAVQVTQPPL